MTLSMQKSAKCMRLLVNSARNLYENPYLNRFKEKCKVSSDFPKKTTGITGLFVNEHPHRALKVLYGRILRTLYQFPKEAAYRIHTEKLITHRLALVEQETDIKVLEEKIGMGQIEEVIEQAENELEATRYILESKAWEPLIEKASEEQWRWPIS